MRKKGCGMSEGNRLEPPGPDGSKESNLKPFCQSFQEEMAVQRESEGETISERAEEKDKPEEGQARRRTERPGRERTKMKTNN
eukprot:scaffold67687_cov60-Attheya_sp.AAC.1